MRKWYIIILELKVTTTGLYIPVAHTAAGAANLTLGVIQLALPMHQHLFPKVKKIVREHNMLRTGDKVAVGVSGGKDSLTTLYALATLRGILPLRFSVMAIVVDMGWPGSDWTAVGDFCKSLDVCLKVVNTRIGPLLFEKRRETNPCALCSRMRHGALNKAAAEAGCNVVALGHHREDAIETLFMNLIYNGRIDCFKPVVDLDRSSLRLIRPMLYVAEKTCTRAAKKFSFPVQFNPCPADGNTRRQHVKELLLAESKQAPAIPRRLLTAIKSLWEEDVK